MPGYPEKGKQGLTSRKPLDLEDTRVKPPYIFAEGMMSEEMLESSLSNMEEYLSKFRNSVDECEFTADILDHYKWYKIYRNQNQDLLDSKSFIEGIKKETIAEAKDRLEKADNELIESLSKMNKCECKKVETKSQL